MEGSRYTISCRVAQEVGQVGKRKKRRQSKSWLRRHCSLGGTQRGSQSVCSVVPRRLVLRVAARRRMRCYRHRVRPGSCRNPARSTPAGCWTCRGTRQSCRTGWRQSRTRMRWRGLVRRLAGSRLRGVQHRAQRCRPRPVSRGGRSRADRWMRRLSSRRWWASGDFGIRRGCCCCPSRSCRW
jgi:hypothetical protein